MTFFYSSNIVLVYHLFKRTCIFNGCAAPRGPEVQVRNSVAQCTDGPTGGGKQSTKDLPQGSAPGCVLHGSVGPPLQGTIFVNCLTICTKAFEFVYLLVFLPIPITNYLLLKTNINIAKSLP